MNVRPDRIGRIGASQVASTLDLNPFQSQRQVQEDILSGRWDPTPREPGNPARMGQNHEAGILLDLEDYLVSDDGLGAPDAQVYPWEPSCMACCRTAVRSQVGQECGSAIVTDGTPTICKGLVSESIQAYGEPWAIATPDGRVEFGTNLALAECKAPFRGRVGGGLYQWGEPGTYRTPIMTPGMDTRDTLIERLRQWPIPIYYAVQAQWQLGVARSLGRPYQFNFLCALGLPFRPTSVFVIEFDPWAFDLMFHATYEWKVRHIENQDPAPIRTREEALKLFPRERPAVKRTLTLAEYELFEEWQRRKILLSVLSNDKGLPGSVKELDAKVLEIVGDAEQVLDPDGNYIGRYPAQATGGRLDSAAIKRLHPDIHKQFFAPGGSTRVWHPAKDWRNSIASELARAGIVESEE